MEPFRALDVVTEWAEAARDDLAFYTPPLDEDVRVEVVHGTLHRFEHCDLHSWRRRVVWPQPFTLTILRPDRIYIFTRMSEVSSRTEGAHAPV